MITVRTIRALAFVLAAWSALASPALAGSGEDAPGELSNLTIEELMEIPVYAASRFAQSAEEAPASVTVVTAREIRIYGWRTLSEALTAAAGIYLSYDRSYEFTGIRGFCRPGDFNTRILVLVDGARTNENIYDSAGLGSDFNLDLDLVDRIEIIRGPGSVMYGTNAFFAVVNVVTKTGPELEGVEAAATAGSFSSFGGRVSLGGAFGADGEYLASGTMRGSGGQDLYYPEFDSPSTNFGVSRDDDGERFESFFGKIRRGPFGASISLVDRTKDRPTASYESVFDVPGNDDRDRRLVADASYSRSFSSDIELETRLSFQDYRYDGHYMFDMAEAGDPPSVVENQDLVRGQWWGVEARVSARPLPRNRVTTGVEYRDNFRLDQGNADEGYPEPYLSSERSSRVFGLYLQDELRLHSRLLVTAGARYDYTHPLNEGKASPRAAFIASPHEGTTCKLIYGEAFRTPNAFELYYHDGYATTKDNPDLEPETIHTVELALDQRVTAAIHGTLSVYRYEIHDLISQTTDPADGLLQYRNADRVVANGFEISLIGRRANGVEGRLWYSWADVHYSATGDWLTNSPRSLAAANVSAPLFRRGLRAGIEARYVGNRLTLDGSEASSYAIVNANVVATGLAEHVECSFGVYNLFDQRYAHPASEEFVQNMIEADGRSIRGKIVYSF